MTTTELLGREHSAGILAAEVNRVLASHGRLVLVTGEAGIGKTALVTDAVRSARRAGALVLGGSCWDSAHAPGYWPWVQVGRALWRALPPGERDAAESDSGGGLAILRGEPGTREREEPGPSQGAEAVRARGTEAAAAPPGAGSTDGDTAFGTVPPDTFALFDAATSALVHAAQNRPIIIVLEDLHWADAASLRLLAFVAQHTWFEQLLIIGTYRDAEVELADDGDGTVGRLRQSLLLPLQSKATTVTLTGLGGDQVAELMARIAGHGPDAELAARVHRHTGGNPFFVEQAARLWVGGGTPLGVTPGVREVLERRLSLLPSAVYELLSTASVLGGAFSRRLLAAVAATPAARVDALLGTAVTGRLVTAEGGGWFAFAHDLVRETLYAALPGERVRALHAAAVQAAESTAVSEGELGSGELARHAYLALPELSVSRVVELLEAAADDAHRRWSMEEALHHRERALEVVRRSDSGDVPPLTTVMLALTLAELLSFHSRSSEAADLYRETLGYIRTLDDPELLARFALALHSSDQMASVLDTLLSEVLTEAHRVLVLGGRERPPGHRPELSDLADQLSLRSAALARDAEDDETLVFALWARHDAIWGLGSAAERESLTAELAEVLDRTGDHTESVFVRSFQWLAKLEQSDPEYLDLHEEFLRRAMTEQAETLALPLLMDRALVASFRGDFRAAQEGLAAGMTDIADTFPFAYLAVHQEWAFQLDQAEAPEMARLTARLSEVGHPYPELLLGLTAVERGEISVALRQFRRASVRAPSYPRTMVPGWLRFQAQLAAATGDTALAGAVRAELAPHADLWLVTAYGAAIDGPVSFWLGVLDAVLGQRDEAVRSLSDAGRVADAMGARLWGVRARAAHAQVLGARGGAADAAEAARLHKQAAAEAELLGLAPVLHQARRLVSVAVPERGQVIGRSGAGTDAGLAAGGAGGRSSEDATEAVREFRWDGTVWQLTFAGRTVHLPAAKGLHDLHRLLGSPSTEVPVVRLLAPEGGEVVATARGMGGDEVLDEEARAQYKRRLDSLDEEIDRAVGRGDDRRAAEYDAERDALLRELRAAAGLAGRNRRLGDEAERARKTVTARIRDVLRKLDSRHPELAEHLRASVSTGMYCQYAPGEALDWRL